ncbi:SAM-dependent methyltransferase [Amycolatopsis tolypomycina]|uniref:S-adenosyl methyltransferase n=1 Tax=Amycolatopsis tolypomycina TaxID=208445 RepID=A0A1H4VG18_9PSEU|nr:SAM-dependent methyltransferase [Amycolatopsis tolypomycina]SEC79528.1 S-adenosyl methyltransferase [Amycolatopsis tolypomycina]
MTQHQEEEWVPPGIDTTKPSSSRTYDYLLGGAHNFQADRDAAEQAEKIMPGIRDVARLNRAFLGRVVRTLMDLGIRQFLDIGSGIPTVGNVHQIAGEIDPGCRVVYVDRDPIAVAHSKMLLSASEHATIAHADFTDPDGIFSHPEVRRLLDFDAPVGLLTVAMLHWIPDSEDPHALLARYRDHVAPGSYLAISHLVSDQDSDRINSAVGTFNRARGHDQATTRTYKEVETMFGDFDLIEPGLVGCALWRPAGPADISDDPHTNTQLYGGVARKAG